jgi:hypothetical protein
MTNPAVRQRLALVDEIGRREAEEEYAALTAHAALARQAVIAAHRHSRWAGVGAVVGSLGFLSFVGQMLSPEAGSVLTAIGIGSFIWLLTDRIGLKRALAWAENRQHLARLARRRLDQVHRHGFAERRLSDYGQPR